MLLLFQNDLCHRTNQLPAALCNIDDSSQLSQLHTTPITRPKPSSTLASLKSRHQMGLNIHKRENF